MKFLHRLISEIEPPNWVMASMALVLVARIPSFFEPYYYGDEMIYLTLGTAIRHGLTLYKQIHDNKPPLLYLTAAIAGNLFWFKAILAFWMLATIIAFWHLTKNLFEENKTAQKVSVIIFAILTTIPLFEGNIVNAELFLIGPIILGITILLAKPTYRNIFLSGLIFSIAALFKIPGVFDIPVIVIFWFMTEANINIKTLVEILKKSLILFTGFIIPIALTFVWYFFKGALPDYLKAAFLENLGYITTWNTVQNQSFIVKHGPLLLRAGIVVISLILLRIKSTKLSKPFILACIWLLTSLFAVTLSERPYPHYMIQSVPAISLLIGVLVSSIKFEQVLTIIPLTLAVFVPVYYKFYYYSTSSYYMRFIQFATHSISKEEYFNNFDKYTTENYNTSKFLMNTSNENDKVFIWGDSAPVMYALAKRLPPIKYTATYHIDSFSSRSDVLKGFQITPPPFIVIPPNSPDFIDLTRFVNQKYLPIYNHNNFVIWKLIAH